MGRLKRGCKYDGWIREFIGYHQEWGKKVIGLGEWMFSDKCGIVLSGETPNKTRRNNTDGSTKSKRLQDKLVQQAAVMLVLAGSEEEVGEYEQVITLVGTAWKLPEKDTFEQLALIQKEREAMRRREKGEPSEHIMPERDILLNWSGLESIEVIEDLFETTTLLDTQVDHRALFRMAVILIECQNLLVVQKVS